jgi:hypothetical protein
MIGRLFRSIYHWMAMSGLLMKDDEPIEKRDPNREWGPPVDGLQLSAKAKGRRLSMVIKNAGSREIREKIPEWLFFYELDLSPQPPLSTFGKHALDPTRVSRPADLVLTPRKAIESEIPVESLYQLGPGPYRVKAACTIAGMRLVSNEVVLN